MTWLWRQIHIYHIILSRSYTTVRSRIHMIPLNTFYTLYHKIPPIKRPFSLHTILHSLIRLRTVMNQAFNSKNTSIYDQRYQNHQNLNLYDPHIHLVLLFQDWCVLLKSVNLGLLLSCGYKRAWVDAFVRSLSW